MPDTIAPSSTAVIPAPSPAAPATLRPRFGDPSRFMNVQGKNVYMIGIGGCGMSGLARMLQARGGLLAGSDMTPSSTTELLEADNITVGFDQLAGRLPDACDLVISSAAIKPDHPQLLEAERRGIPTMNYAEALGRCMVGRTAIAIAGTHGKSTTTAMLGTLLADTGLDPTVIVGAHCPQLGPGGGGFRLGAEAVPAGSLKGEPGILVAEACEFNRSFHNYHPTIAVITAVEADHLDCYGSLEAIIESFRDFAKLLPASTAPRPGLLLIAHQGAHRREVAAGLECDVQTIGFSPEADWVVRYDPATRDTELLRRTEQGLVHVNRWTTPMPGAHNAMNAATAATIAQTLGAQPARVAASLESFRGLDRRSQFLGERTLPGGAGGVRVYDDYGHHPTEVDVTLRALRDFEKPQDRNGRLVCVFQPHQHSRTRFLLDEFASAFSSADIVIVPHIYFVRDSQAEKQKVSAADLVDKLRARGVQAMHLYPFDAIVEQLQIVCRPGDLLVVMGAGPVNKIAESYLSR
jgi:UDP-N-acetylmuramate--alanine ligase